MQPRNLAGRPIESLVFLSVDVETTGFGPADNAVIEIGTCLFSPGAPAVHVESWLVDPGGITISEGAGKVHGITQEMLVGEVSTGDAIARLGALVSKHGPDALLGHNFPFDQGFLESDARRVGIERGQRPHAVCSLALARKLRGNGGNNLGELAKTLGIPLRDGILHRAGYDALSAALVFQALIKAHSPRIQSWDDLEAAGCVIRGVS